MLHHFAASRPISHGIFVAICHWNCVKVLCIFQPTAEVDPIAQSNRSNRPSPVIRTSKAATRDDKVKNRSRQVPNFPITASNPKTRVKLFQNFRPNPASRRPREPRVTHRCEVTFSLSRRVGRSRKRARAGRSRHSCARASHARGNPGERSSRQAAMSIATDKQQPPQPPPKGGACPVPDAGRPRHMRHRILV